MRESSPAEIHVLPVVHDRLESAALARAALDQLDPALVAVELPTTLAEAAAKAVARLPHISVVISEEPGEDALVWAVAPGDPIAEALRWAAERGRPTVCIDPDLPYGGRHPDPLPDPYAAWSLGGRYLELLAAAGGEAGAGDDDLRREAGMAHHLQQARERLAAEGGESDGGPILALVGAAHADRLARRLTEPTAVPLARTRRQNVLVRHLHPRSLTALLPDPPLAHAAWELLRAGGEPPDTPLAATVGRRLSLVRGGLTLLGREGESWGAERRRRVVEHAAGRAGRPGLAGALPAPDRRRLGRAVWAMAARSHAEHARAELAPWQRRGFFDFARRYARWQGQLVPGLYEWVVAARGVADDNLAWEVFEIARAYPWQEELAEIASVEIDGDELDLGTRKVRFRRRFFRVKRRPMMVPVRERPQSDNPEDWLAGFKPGGLCSYPPEDLVVEDYGRHLRAKAVGVLTAERSRVEPFTSSLLDGVDLRETLRHRVAQPGDDRIWVHEQGRAPGKAGSVVVVFDRDRDPGGQKYPYLMTWLGEHDQESDMAFYSTHPAEQVVGPGILRATYGGFLMTVPPGRLYDVWQDPDYSGAGEKAEVLVLAAVDYSEDPLVAHVAARPPAPHLHAYAAARGKTLVHIPLGSLTRSALEKVRTLHILVGHDKRKIAGDYIW